MQHAPDTVLILLRARAEIIVGRMRENPHSHPVVQERDIELVLQRFEEQYRDSLIRKKFALDTSDAKPAETLKAFAAQIEKHLSQTDRLRLIAHQSWPGAT